LDLPLDFVKTQAQTQRLEGTEDSRADSETQQASFTGSREFLRDGGVVTPGRTAALFGYGTTLLFHELGPRHFCRARSCRRRSNARLTRGLIDPSCAAAGGYNLGCVRRERNSRLA